MHNIKLPVPCSAWAPRQCKFLRDWCSGSYSVSQTTQGEHPVLCNAEMAHIYLLEDKQAKNA